MKKLYILVLIFIISLSTISCKKTYKLTENKEILSFGQKGKYGYIYNEEVYYEVPKNIVVGLVDNSLKGKFSVAVINYDIDGNITSVYNKKTYILKKDKTLTIKLYETVSEGINSVDEYVEYVSSKEVLYLYEGMDIYIDSSYFE